MVEMIKSIDVVIVGAGPAGMFCAERLAKAGPGLKIVVLDAGRSMRSRECPKTTGCSCVVCDILEGEGGAGGFSDGKKTYSLTRGTNLEDLFDPSLEPLLDVIDSTIVRFSPSPGVWYDPPTGLPEGLDLSAFDVGSYPLRHIGSDGVRGFITSYREYLEALGVRFMMSSEVQDAVRIDGGGFLVVPQLYWTKSLVIATGLTGWTWAESLMNRMRVGVSGGAASIGLRYEAPAELMAPIFDWFYDFKLQQGRLRSFCCNHHGQVVNQRYRRMGLRCVNGDSFLDPALRTGYSNMAILAKLSGNSGQQDIVRTMAGIITGMVNGATAVQRATDFLNGIPSSREQLEGRTTNPQSRPGADIGDGLLCGLREEFQKFISDFERALGIPEGVGTVYAPEIKYAGFHIPVDFRSFRVPSVDGLYVIGNATGKLDSFVSAAITGIVAADDLIRQHGRINQCLD
jgi:uncharacterized protein